MGALVLWAMGSVLMGLGAEGSGSMGIWGLWLRAKCWGLRAMGLGSKGCGLGVRSYGAMGLGARSWELGAKG